MFTRGFRFVERRVHEHLERGPSQGRLMGTIHHYPYRDFTHWLEKTSRYARLGAEDLFESGRRARGVEILTHPLGRFLRAYLAEGSWRDGRFGLVTSCLGAYGAFLKYLFLWSLEWEDLRRQNPNVSPSAAPPPSRGPPAGAPRSLQSTG